MQKLPLDLTAHASGNSALEYYLIDTSANFPIVPYQGAFYFDTPPGIYEIVGGRPSNPLTLGTDYVPVGYDPVLSEKSGSPVYTGLLIFAKSRVNKLGITLQYVGTKTAVNKNALQAAIEQLSNQAVPYSVISDLPLAFPATSHTEQLANFSGWDSVVELLNDASGLYSTFMAQRHAGTGYNAYESISEVRIDSLNSFCLAVNAQLPSAVLQHINNTAYPHVLSPSNLGLGLVANYTFASGYSDANKAQYVSPKVLKDLIDNHGPTPDYSNHSHHETAADIGIGNVVNLGMKKDYAAGDYATLNQVPAYISGYATANAVKDAITSNYALGFYTSVSASVTAAISAIGADSTAIADKKTQIQQLAQTVSDALDAQKSIIETSIESQVVQYQQKINNGLYAAVLSKLSDIEFANYAAGNNVYPRGVFPVPRELPWPSIWIDPSDPLACASITVGGQEQLYEIRNKGVAGGSYKAPNGFYALRKLSADADQSILGESARVISFEPGRYLESNTVTDLTGKDFTIIALVQVVGGGECTVISGKNGTTIKASSNDALNLNENARVPHIPAGPVNSYLSVLQVTQKNHLAASYGTSSSLSATAYQTLSVTNGLAQAVVPFADGIKLSILGNYGNSDPSARFELTELIVYERILSVPEIKALVKYLNYKHSKTLAYAIHYPDAISS